MPAQRKPTAVLELAGAFKRNPARSRKGEPQAAGVGPARPDLDPDVRAVWDEIVSNCAAGVFQSSDRLMLEGLATLIVEFRANPADFGGRKWQQLLQMLARCGMTPADRSRVIVKPREEDKPKTGLAAFR